MIEDLGRALALDPSGSGSPWRTGQAVYSSEDGWRVNVAGATLRARFADPLVLSDGDSVLVVIVGAQVGQSEAFVLAKTTDRPRPDTATVTTVPVSSPTITVTSVDGQVFTARFVGTAPSVGDQVLLLWQSPSSPVVVGKVGSVTAPSRPVPPPPPPGQSQTGTTRFAATATGTYSNGTLNSYYGQHLVQGVYGPRNNAGFWFYGGSPAAALGGRVVTGVRVRVPPRRRIGNYNDPATFHIHVHGAAAPPANRSQPALGAHVFDVTMPPNGQGGMVALPTIAGQAIVDNGGGLAIAGDPYAGLTGRGEFPDSGLLEIDWRRS